MANLITRPNLPDPDSFYANLIQTVEGLGDEGASAFNARLILLLCNHIGDPEVLKQAVKEAARNK